MMVRKFIKCINSTKIHETIETQINNYKMRQHKNFRNASIDIIKQIPTDDNAIRIIVIQV